MRNIILKNAFIVDPSQKINGIGTIIVKNSLISDLILKNIELNNNNFLEIDCKGLILCPGFVDIKCHLRVPGDEHKENLSYASQSAGSAGITSLVCMPNTDPIIDNVSMVEFYKEKLEKKVM